MGTEHVKRRSRDDEQSSADATRPVTLDTVRRARLPADLRTGVESLSGFAMDDVRVHYDSPEPGRVGALAFAQGSTIHVAPGQEQHLPHEAWHVVQQAQGRVSPTARQDRAPVLNEHSALEREAETMGARVARLRRTSAVRPDPTTLRPLPAGGRVIQLMKAKGSKDEVTTLDGLNAKLKQFGSSARVSTEDFDTEPTARALDAAVAASTMTIEKATTKRQLVAELTAKLTAPAAKAKSPLEIRKEAAKACAAYDRGEYLGGGANALHVHVIAGNFHLKGPGGRKNIYVDGALRKDALKEARESLVGHAMASTLNAAIDKALLDHGQSLDTY